MTSVVHHPGHLRIVKLVAADPQPGRIWIRCGTVSEKNVEIRYWVARGIGHFWFLGETLTLERIRRPLPGGLPADGEESHPAEP